MFCQNCGSKQPDDGVFCNECGEKLVMPIAPDAENPQAEAQNAVADTQDEAPVAEVSEAVQGTYNPTDAIEDAPVTGSYSFAQSAEPADTNVPVQGAYADPVQPETYSEPIPADAAPAKKKKLLFDDSDPQGQTPPKAPRMKKERAQKPVQPQSDAFSPASPAPKKGNGLYLAIIGTLAAAIIGVGVWLFITLGKVSTASADLALKESKITELQQSVDGLNAAKTQDQQSITTLQSSVTDLTAQLAATQEKSTFFDTYAGITPDDGTKLYHTYQCTHFDHSLSFAIYNVTAAKSAGYSPCPYCH